ncbi:MAG: hypothetical protein JO201_01690, partial [Verrucomicrobia bacterium]|nr:hypothetical protein [Verrucomicrobiota bacterium]
MSTESGPNKNPIVAFRTKLSAAMMLVVAAITAFGLYLAQRNVTRNAERARRSNFRSEVAALDKLLELRHAAVSERCQRLAANPRIHAALEDNALDLLYPTAKDELRDLMENRNVASNRVASTLHAKFYRFLDNNGAVLPPANPNDVGPLAPQTEARLVLERLPQLQQNGYIDNVADGSVAEVAAVPIISSATGDVISAIMLGFDPLELVPQTAGGGIKSGLWVNGRLHLPSLDKSQQEALTRAITHAFGKLKPVERGFPVTVNGAPHLLFYKLLNPNSVFPPAYEVSVYPLADSMEELRRLRWQIGGAGGLLFLGGFVASHFIARRFSKPVEQLALDSERNRAQRKRAEDALITASERLKRSTRYSADASHQLKSPLTVLRAGLEALLGRDDFNPETYEELSILLHQTHRLNGVIEDLLLLSRMDTGHLQIDSEPVDLSQLVEEWIDDLNALPDAPDVKIQKDIPPNLFVLGAKQYISLIVQNLLENARKYNCKGGSILVSLRTEP